MDSSVCLRSSMLVRMSKRPASMTSLAISIFSFWMLLRTSDSMLSAYSCRALPSCCACSPMPGFTEDFSIRVN